MTAVSFPDYLCPHIHSINRIINIIQILLTISKQKKAGQKTSRFLLDFRTYSEDL